MFHVTCLILLEVTSKNCQQQIQLKFHTVIQKGLKPNIKFLFCIILFAEKGSGHFRGMFFVSNVFVCVNKHWTTSNV